MQRSKQQCAWELPRLFVWHDTFRPHFQCSDSTDLECHLETRVRNRPTGNLDAILWETTLWRSVMADWRLKCEVGLVFLCALPPLLTYSCYSQAALGLRRALWPLLWCPVPFLLYSNLPSHKIIECWQNKMKLVMWVKAKDHPNSIPLVAYLCNLQVLQAFHWLSKPMLCLFPYSLAILIFCAIEI